MGHSPGHDRDPLAVQALPFHLILFGDARVQMLSPFLPVSIFVHQKKGEHMSKSCGLGYSTVRVITAEMGQFA